MKLEERKKDGPDVRRTMVIYLRYRHRQQRHRARSRKFNRDDEAWVMTRCRRPCSWAIQSTMAYR